MKFFVLRKKLSAFSLALFMTVSLGMLFRCLYADTMVTGHDAIVKTGNTVTLLVKVERKIISYLAPDVKGISITFCLANDAIGTAVTNHDGIAQIQYLSEKPGIYSIDYRLLSSKAKIRQGKLFVISGDRPALVTDIDGTISDYPDWKVPFGGGTAPAFPYAAELFGKLALQYEIIYLSARDNALDGVTTAFLKKHNFPDGPIFYNDWGFSKAKRQQLSAKYHGAFKLKMIEQMRALGVPIVAGIGNAATDVEAYHGAKITAYILKSKKYKIVAPAILFDDYRMLEQLLENKHADYQKQVQDGAPK